MTNIVRDPDAMDQFNSVIEDFDDTVLAICNRMESALDEAQASINDDLTHQSINALYEFIEQVRAVTDPMSDVGESLSKGAKTLRRAQDIFGG